ncbi:multicopper oxidase domain-containing protein [Mycobacterium sp. SM1]|uniref:multicopper oxidase family protein n=1 Tax=Mycobacterium sp. SM1 TaxID=2816243 RepID=UPI001BD01B39|nr:multicopper oxidase domain-containing protein [Mycobacterium sp. SM1]MBS4728287.1 multicopper oxidase domain-containing protein [Mycobacterium sp. SM1]
MAATGAAGVLGNASVPAHAGGEELRDLPEMASENGVLDTALDMVTKPVELGGRQLTLETYNGQLPGPILRIRPGDNLRIRLTNQMVPVGIPTNNVLMIPYCAAKSNDARYDTRRACVHDLWNKWERAGTILQQDVITNLHTHGLQVSPEDPGDNVFLRLDPPFSHQYSYDIPKDQPAGLYWYHPHYHTSTAHQGWNGLAGPIIVEGDIDAVPEIAEMRERTIVINELLIADDSGESPYTPIIPIVGPVPFDTIPAVPAAMYYPLNGQLIPDITVQPGEAQRWRVLNACPHRSIWLHIEGHTLQQIGTDGIPYRAPRTRQHIMLSSANRAEFIVKAGEPGRYRVYAKAYDQGHPGGPRPYLPLATLVVRGKRVDSRLPSTLVQPPRMPDLPVARRRNLVFSGDITGRTGFGVQFLIDGKEFNAERIDQEVEAGTVEEWTIINEDIFQHPIHIHVNPFQVFDVQGIPPGDSSWNTEPDIWWDTFRIPPFGRYTLRTYFRPDVTGKTVYHCHILPHEDRSMMGTLLIDPPGGYPRGES